MPTKKTKTAAPKPKAKAKAKPKAAVKAAPKLECRVCGYRVIVDEACGCVEEHVLVCCGQPMAKA
jgi:hypothetical protein